ncbi:MAG TPA: PEP/pyruvate-binding domain-containing protein, partial [Planctomycetota bacterium]|nr:PEP/pyruvate-binding domain-containing protein [Planctomycetota bacterium]
MTKHVYSFGGGKAEGHTAMKELLGGKGANLAEMASIGLPVPPGFTITTEVCVHFMKTGGKYPGGLEAEVKKALAQVEKLMGRKFGDPANPLLFSVRSGARSSMPGMMETVLNIGLTSKTLEGFAASMGDNRRLAYDAYRRLITMYSDVVMEKAAGVEPRDDEGIRVKLEHAMDALKEKRGVKLDTELTADDLVELCDTFRRIVKDTLGKPFPDDAMEQLWGGIGAVFQSW